MAAWFSGFDQISFASGDIDKAIVFWEQQMGIGPWTVFRGITLSMRYDNMQIALPAHVAVTWHDGRVVELIELAGNGPSPFHDGLNRPIVGLQRLASVTSEIERDAAEAEGRGMERFADGEAAGQRFVYFRSPEAPGVILELLERTAMFEDLVRQLQARAAAYVSSSAVLAPPTLPRVTDIAARAAQLVAYGDADLFRISDTVVGAPRPGEVRIRVAGAAVNPVDIKARRGVLHVFVPLAFPAQLGGDVAGVVEAVGPGVTDFAIGDRVAGMLNPFAKGAYASHIRAPANSLAKVPDDLDLADAAAAPTGVLTGSQLVELGIRPRAGDRVLIAGAAGSTGRAAVMAALDAGAEVYAGIRASAAEHIADLPVRAIVDLADEEALEAAGPFDAVGDTVGGDVAEGLFAHLKPHGVLASIAVPPPVPPSGATQRFCSLTVTFDRARLERFYREWATGLRHVPIATRLPLASVGEAHKAMEEGGLGGKIILTP
jgi:NADPH:quinone reductase-like Zn-dependent oxidoreductase